ncbi:MAG: phosphoribosylanthranilate isomerase [Rhodospirillaceae bacterium]|nr:phosphoribosylanthranilate isomerase [Rhodospirillaceae bacterium]|tara:strand:+ start:8777 stop:9424 length:648 start_codon:yes stop_codon:yes gene_type:complete
MTVKVKICGINTKESLEAAILGGADAIGFVFFSRSPRALNLHEAARLAVEVPKKILRVGLIVDMTDIEILELVKTVPLDLLQLHGEETPERTAQIGQVVGLPLIKAIKVADMSDITAACKYKNHVDWILFDAKPPEQFPNALPGGNAISFNWNWLANKDLTYPWILSGGLNVQNIREAINISGATFLDVSSGVESRVGKKNINLITDFLGCVKQL